MPKAQYRLLEYPDYLIDIEGNVYSTLTNNYLKHHLDRYGYLYVNLRKNKKGKKEKVHRLVAKTFIFTKDYSLQVNHINGNKLDNRVDNLEWCTPKQNTYHGIKTGLIKNRGTNNANSKLTIDEVLKIIELKHHEISQRKIAEMYDITQSMVSKIQLRQSWKHLDV